MGRQLAQLMDRLDGYMRGALSEPDESWLELTDNAG
jgi:hypothetical protein